MVIEDAQAEVTRLIAHRQQREAKSRIACAALVAAIIDVLVTSVYDDVDPRLHPVAKGSLLAHLLKLEADGRAARDDVRRCDVVDERVRQGAALSSLSRCSLILDGHVVLDEIDFALHRGQRLDAVGPNGSGKTLLLKMLRGDRMADADRSRAADRAIGQRAHRIRRAGASRINMCAMGGT